MRLTFLAATLAGVSILSTAARADEVEEVIVTARRVDERDVTVPLATHIVSANRIAIGSVEGLETLASSVPALSFEAIWGGWNSFPVLRGQSQPSVAGDATGVFVDGVYQANRNAVDIEPLDLDRIEVVEGPQSALFGHSTFAGLIHYVSARPTDTPFVSVGGDLGTDGLYAVRGVVSGPVNDIVNGRIAASSRGSEGTWSNAAAAGQHLGAKRRLAIAASIATRDDVDPFSINLALRYGDNRYGMAPSFALDYRRFNCGGFDGASGRWTYFCGPAPLPNEVSLSPNSPDSETRTGQVALHIARSWPGLELRSDTSYYDARADSIRDLDGGAVGDVFGVCLVGVNCNGAGSLAIPVVRLQTANVVLRRTLTVGEASQEFRLRNIGSGNVAWQVGGIAFSTLVHTRQSIGAERGALAGNERLATLFLGNPTQVGPVATINRALTEDPNANQFVQNDVLERRRTFAILGAAEYRLGERVRLRGEARATWERQTLDSRLSQFAPSFGKSVGARSFFDLTPRISLDYRPRDRWLMYVSEARGSRSGGINPAPNLLPEEQTFGPETNWTTEAGLKYTGAGMVRSLQATGYHIDWSDTQILGFPTTPGVGILTTRNIRGVQTRGAEFSISLQPIVWLSLDAAFNYTRPRYKAGSEDPGSSDICGLGVGVTSTACRITVSQEAPGRLVPDISGNRPARAVQASWAARMTLTPPLALTRAASLRIDLSHQGDVFEREPNGLRYGARTLLSARITLPLGKSAIELWGVNLANDRYVDAAAPRAPAFYIGQPRPVDLLLAETRRVGITVRYER